MSDVWALMVAQWMLTTVVAEHACSRICHTRDAHCSLKATPRVLRLQLAAPRVYDPGPAEVSDPQPGKAALGMLGGRRGEEPVRCRQGLQLGFKRPVRRNV